MPTWMRAELKPHPDFPCPAGSGIEVEVERSGATLALSYRLRGATKSLRVPSPAPPVRADELWRHTCFEAFVAQVGGNGYCELNFSPSCAWAAYSFDGYRSGMGDLEVGQPRVACTVAADRIELQAELELQAPGRWRLGLAAVVEAADGSLSYWALRHPAGRPDFHHRDCFAVELAPAA